MSEDSSHAGWPPQARAYLRRADPVLLALRREDVVLPGDLALRKAIEAAYQLDHLPTQEEVQAIAENWRPYRSLATSYLFSAPFRASRGITARPAPDRPRPGLPRLTRMQKLTISSDWVPGGRGGARSGAGRRRGARRAGRAVRRDRGVAGARSPGRQQPGQPGALVGSPSRMELDLASR